MKKHNDPKTGKIRHKNSDSSNLTKRITLKICGQLKPNKGITWALKVLHLEDYFCL